jgi:16S rRNA (uracil1498-N3)-methyltransferase
LYVDARLAPATGLTLNPERSHYLCRVLRQRRGDHVLLFCGDGIGYDARIDDPDPHACRVSILDIAETEAPPRLRLHLGQAMIKGERLDFVLQKATELGVTDIWLLETERTEVRYLGSRIARRETHWQRIVQGAAEQSRRLRLPLLHPPISLHTLLTQQSARQVLLLEPGAPPIDTLPEHDTLLLVGPEGGFSDAERASAHALGAQSMGMGRLILRADTAPVAALTILRQGWRWNAP